MKVIDIHTHLAVKGIYPQRYLKSMLSADDKDGIDLLLSIFLNDKKGERLVKQKKAANVEKSVLLIIDGELGIERPLLSIEEIYALHHDVLKSNPHDFIVFAGIDPRRGQAGIDLFKKSIEEYGFRGLKLYPPMGYRMNDTLLKPYYEICQTHQLPVLIHTGPSSSFLKNELADPMDVRAICDRYPGISFILAHAGLRLLDGQLQALLEIENVYFDIAGYQATSGFYDEYLSVVFAEKYSRKIVYGSDWPLFHLRKSLEEDLSFLINKCQAIGISEEVLERVFYTNAKRILKIE